MTRRNKGSKWVLALIIALLIVMTACSNNNSGTANKPTKPAANNGKIEITYWHYMGGFLGETIATLAESFNNSQSDIVVTAVYQGTYDEALNKMKAAMGTNSGPSIMHSNDGGTRFMIDSGAITPMQQFIDADNMDLSQFEQHILDYYTIDDQLNSMPFNTSNLIMYYNKDLFRSSGLDPDNPPTTFDEMVEAGKKLTKDDVTGMAFAIESWNLEQLLANQGAEFVNNGNGRDEPATASIINSDAAIQTVEWWHGLIADNIALNLGRKADAVKKAFGAQQLGMIFATTASLRELNTAAEGKFEVGTGFLPKPANAKEGGVVVGGGSLYIMNNKSEEEQQAAFEFIKYIMSPEQQAIWHVNTGYFPVTKAAYEQQIVKDNFVKYPQFKTAIDQLHQTVSNRATQGAVIGVFPETRQLVETALEEVFSGSKSAKDALDQAAKDITAKIELYNKTVTK